MNYGMYLSASALRIGDTRMNVLANNMANVNTTSFKPDTVMVRSRRPAPAELDLPPWLVMPVLDDVKGGMLPDGAATTFTQGPVVKTGGDLDVALQGDGFFAVDADGQTRYTRDGRFARDDQGFLVTAAGGFRVLDEAGSPIRLPAGKVKIDTRGRIEVGGTGATLGIVAFADAAALRKAGKNTYTADGSATATDSTATVNQGFIEDSAVEPSRALVDMITAQRTYEASARMIQYADSMLGRAVNDIARLA